MPMARATAARTTTAAGRSPGRLTAPATPVGRPLSAPRISLNAGRARSSAARTSGVFQRGHSTTAGELLETWRPMTGHGGDFAGHQKQFFANADDMKQKIREQMIRPPYDVTTLYYQTGIAQRIAKSALFEMVTLGFITINALWMSVDTDFNKSQSLVHAHPVFQVVENVFCCYFFFEWSVRFFAFQHKLSGFRDAWFLFDTCLVFMMVIETWVMSLVILLSANSSSGGMGTLSIMRIARLLRLTRISRMARLLRAMPEVMILVKGMAAAMRSVCFTLFLLIMFVYIFAIVMRQVSDGTPIGNKYFSTVPYAMQVLLNYGTILDNFGIFTQDIGSNSPELLPIVYLFSLCSALTLMNMLVGVLVEVVSAVASTEKEALSIRYVKERMQTLMDRHDREQDKEISREEFQDLLANPEAHTILAEVEVDIISLVDCQDFLFEGDEIDEQGHHVEKTLTFSEFMDLVLSLRGSNSATVADVVQLQKVLGKQIRWVANTVEKQQKETMGMIAAKAQSQMRKMTGDVQTQLERMKSLDDMQDGPIKTSSQQSLAPRTVSLEPLNGNDIEQARLDSIVPTAPKSALRNDGIVDLDEKINPKRAAFECDKQMDFGQRAKMLLNDLLHDMVHHYECCVSGMRSENKRLIGALASAECSESLSNGVTSPRTPIRTDILGGRCKPTWVPQPRLDKAIHPNGGDHAGDFVAFDEPPPDGEGIKDAHSQCIGNGIAGYATKKETL